MFRPVSSPFRSYMLLQTPDILLAGIVLWLLHAWAGLPARWSGGLWALWILKDIAMYPLLRDAFAPSRAVGPEQLIGARGTAMEALAPAGYVRVAGELWAAERAGRGGGEVPAGRSVVVRGIRGLTLLVEPDIRSPPDQENPPSGSPRPRGARGSGS